MTKIIHPWEQDPIEYLVRGKFRDEVPRRDNGSPRLEACDDLSSSDPDLESQIQAYRRHLRELSAVEIGSLIERQREADRERWRKKAEAEENARFFNRPASRADVRHWAKMAFWTISEANALSVGRNPHLVTWDNVKAHLRDSPFAKKFMKNRELVLRAARGGCPKAKHEA